VMTESGEEAGCCFVPASVTEALAESWTEAAAPSATPNRIAVAELCSRESRARVREGWGLGYKEFKGEGTIVISHCLKG
jgi:hypothetical protein